MQSGGQSLQKRIESQRNLLLKITEIGFESIAHTETTQFAEVTARLQHDQKPEKRTLLKKPSTI